MVDIFKALSENNRLRILALLLENDLCVCEIESILNITQSNASKHLLVLKQCGILHGYKKSQWAYYGVSDKFKKEHSDLYQYLITKLKEAPTYKDDYERLIKCRLEDFCSICIKP